MECRSDAAWDTVSSNWTPTATFASGDNAIFDGTSVFNVTSATGLTIGTISLNAAIRETVTMSGANTVNGATTISSGTLSLTNAGGLGTSAVTVNSGGTLAINREPETTRLPIIFPAPVWSLRRILWCGRQYADPLW